MNSESFINSQYISINVSQILFYSIWCVLSASKRKWMNLIEIYLLEPYIRSHNFYFMIALLYYVRVRAFLFTYNPLYTQKIKQIVIKRLSTFLVDCNVPTNILWVIQTVWWFLHDKNYIVASEFILMLFWWFINGMPDFVSSTKWNSHIYFLHYVWLGLLPFL